MSIFSQPLHFPDARILIIDDEPHNVLLLQDVLEEAGYSRVEATTDARQGLALCESYRPDLLLLDLSMPHLDGFEVMEKLRKNASREAFLPILVLTADVSPEVKLRALRGGANDFLTKPFDHAEALLRINNLLTLHFLHGELHSQNLTLEERVRERAADLEEAQFEIVERLAHAAEFRDDDTGQHTQRVGFASGLVATAMALPKRQIELLRRTAPLHDVGKIGIPDNILLKPGKLTDEEFDKMKTHTTIGATLLSGGKSDLVQMAERIALSHHERWQGNGYPTGLAGGNIQVEGLIVSVVDVFDALTHERPYKKAWPIDRAVEEITAQKGRQFCPATVEAFVQIVPAILESEGHR